MPRPLVGKLGRGALGLEWLRIISKLDGVRGKNEGSEGLAPVARTTQKQNSLLARREGPETLPCSLRKLLD